MSSWQSSPSMSELRSSDPAPRAPVCADPRHPADGGVPERARVRRRMLMFLAGVGGLLAGIAAIAIVLASTGTSQAQPAHHARRAALVAEAPDPLAIDSHPDPVAARSHRRAASP